MRQFLSERIFRKCRVLPSRFDSFGLRFLKCFRKRCQLYHAPHKDIESLDNTDAMNFTSAQRISKEDRDLTNASKFQKDLFLQDMELWIRKGILVKELRQKSISS